MEGHRGRQFREDQIREKARLAAAAVDLEWLNEQERKTSDKLHYTQIVEIEVEDGHCYTSYYPDNHEIIAEFAGREKTPLLIRRLLYFLNGVPSEYHWAGPKEVEGRPEPRARQTMLWSHWLRLIEREEAAATGHAGPLYSSND